MGDGREAHPGTDRSDSGPAGSARQLRDDAGRLQRHALLHNPLQPRHRAGRQHRGNDLVLRSAHGRMGPAAERDGVRAPWRCGVDRARRTPRLPQHPLAADCAGRSHRRARRVLRAPRRDRPHREFALAHEADGRTGRVNIKVASGNCRGRCVRAKAAAGFTVHANGPAVARLLRKLGLGADHDRSTLRGPADLGKRVDLAEQSARHGAGDPGRGDALKKDAEGKWE